MCHREIEIRVNSTLQIADTHRRTSYRSETETETEHTRCGHHAYGPRRYNNNDNNSNKNKIICLLLHVFYRIVSRALGASDINERDVNGMVSL